MAGHPSSTGERPARSALAVLRNALAFRWLVVVGIFVPAALVGVAAVETRPVPSDATSVVGAVPESADTVSADGVRLALGRYAVSLTSTETVAALAETTGLTRDTVRGATSVAVDADAGTLTIRVSLPNGESALALCAATAQTAVQLGEDDPLSDTEVLSTARLEPAGPLASPRLLELALLLAAALAAVGAACALELRRPSVATGGDAAAVAGAPVLGNLPPFVGPWPRRRLADDREILQAARTLRSGWTTSAGSVPPGPVAVVGTEVGAGATTATFLMARTMGDRGESTLVLDLDLDAAHLTSLMEVDADLVLDDVLAERTTLAEAVVQEGPVSVLAARPEETPDDVVDRRLPEVLKQAEDRWQVVLCDTTPLAAGESSELVTAHAASAVVVVRRGSSLEALERTVARLDRLGVPVRGLVLNAASRDQAEAPATGAGPHRA
ncbi:hypothetical protein [Nocardioides litoris]|uniref:hypothetical protein n=1 Tax=Nocardioides litoris TaxID=1926648 RepID=UPI00111D80BA|nr:hypothetical protein [Nocardioides litoris]